MFMKRDSYDDRGKNHQKKSDLRSHTKKEMHKVSDNKSFFKIWEQ